MGPASEGIGGARYFPGPQLLCSPYPPSIVRLEEFNPTYIRPKIGSLSLRQLSSCQILNAPEQNDCDYGRGSSLE